MTSAMRLIAMLTVVAGLSAAVAADGLIVVESARGVSETTDRLQSLIEQRGLTVFSRIDHAAGAASIGSTLPPTELLIFGNPRGGTPFMQCAQTVGIDLPLKVLVWEDESSRVWVGYNDPAFIAARHEVTDCPVVENLRTAVHGLVMEAVGP